jgi:serine/threonine protein kinase
MARLGRDYDVPRWKDEGRLLVSGPKDFIRKATERTTGRPGVLKHRSGRWERFYAEALNMRRLTGTPGIMPVWDIDETHPDEPRWYAMPAAQPLDEALGPDATLREVVQAVASLAGVLASLAEREGTYHRDIKPANLFALDGIPVLADFGIAAWLTTSPEARDAGITGPTERLGPANFIAPEMRLGRPDDWGTRADVYSLAKTLFVLALPGRGQYPPDGMHRADGDEFSMGNIGAARPLAELLQVLEAAAEFNRHRRLSMPDLRDELRAWLAHYPGEQFRRRGDQPGYATLAAWGRQASQYRRNKEYTDRMMVPYISRIAEALTGDPAAWVNEDGKVTGKS